MLPPLAMNSWVYLADQEHLRGKVLRGLQSAGAPSKYEAGTTIKVESPSDDF